LSHRGARYALTAEVKADGGEYTDVPSVDEAVNSGQVFSVFYRVIPESVVGLSPQELKSIPNLYGPEFIQHPNTDSHVRRIRHDRHTNVMFAFDTKGRIWVSSKTSKRAMQETLHDVTGKVVGRWTLARRRLSLLGTRSTAWLNSRKVDYAEFDKAKMAMKRSRVKRR